MLVTREYHTVAQARDVLQGALDRASAPCLFDRLGWFEILHSHCFAHSPVRILQATEGERQGWMFLLAPRRGQLSALANWYSFSWRPLFIGQPDDALRGHMVEAMAQYLLKDSARIDLYPVTESCPMLLGAFRRAGWFAVPRSMGRRHLLPVEGRDFASYWAGRPGRLRNLVARKARASRFTLSIADRLTSELWQDYLTVTARSWKPAEPGVDFLHALAQAESDAGTLRLGFARIGGQPVATQLWTVENGTALIHKLAHDQAFDGASPGTLLSHAMFRQAIDQDHVELIDYGTGDNGYKTDWMERRETLQRLDLFNPRFASSWLPAARTAISALVG